MGCGQDSVTAKLPSLAMRTPPPPSMKPGQPQALGQKVGFSFGGSETEALTGTGVGQTAGPFHPAWLLLVDFPSWLGKRTAGLCPLEVTADDSVGAFGGLLISEHSKLGGWRRGPS